MDLMEEKTAVHRLPSQERRPNVPIHTKRRPILLTTQVSFTIFLVREVSFIDNTLFNIKLLSYSGFFFFFVESYLGC